MIYGNKLYYFGCFIEKFCNHIFIYCIIFIISGSQEKLQWLTKRWCYSATCRIINQSMSFLFRLNFEPQKVLKQSSEYWLASQPCIHGFPGSNPRRASRFETICLKKSVSMATLSRLMIFHCNK